MSSKIVEIRPNPNFVRPITGSFMISKEFKDKDGKVILSLIGRESLTIPAEGMLLQPDEFPLHKAIIKAAKEIPEFASMLGYCDNPSELGVNQRFYLHDQAQADKSEYEAITEQHAIVNEILNMDDRVINFAKLFGITSKDKTACKNKLVLLASKDAEMRRKIGEYYNNPDRLLLEVIHASLEKGNPSEKKGLYAVDGYYFYMGNSIGYGLQKVVDWAKEEKDIYSHLKEDIYGKDSGKGAKAKA